jgi:hypothetical protein
MIKRIMIVLIGAIVSSGCIDRYRVIHVPLELDSPCEFAKFTEAEKDSMSEAVGVKIDSNQNNCYVNDKANQAIIKKHNEEHK